MILQMPHTHGIREKLSPQIEQQVAQLRYYFDSSSTTTFNQFLELIYINKDSGDDKAMDMLKLFIKSFQDPTTTSEKQSYLFQDFKDYIAKLDIHQSIVKYDNETLQSNGLMLLTEILASMV